MRDDGKFDLSAPELGALKGIWTSPVARETFLKLYRQYQWVLYGRLRNCPPDQVACVRAQMKMFDEFYLTWIKTVGGDVEVLRDAVGSAA